MPPKKVTASLEPPTEAGESAPLKPKKSGPYQEFSRKNWDNTLTLAENSKRIAEMWRVKKEVASADSVKTKYTKPPPPNSPRSKDSQFSPPPEGLVRSKHPLTILINKRTKMATAGARKRPSRDDVDITPRQPPEMKIFIPDN
jgi:hypothetical protein